MKGSNKMNNRTLNITLNSDGQITAINIAGDRFGMNWAEGWKPWGYVIKPDELDLKVNRYFNEKGGLTEEYVFINNSPFDVFTLEGQVSVCTPFNDSYHDARTCEEKRCHTHIWCGGENSWVMGLRMGRYAPHLGLVLTKGSLVSYDVVRDLSLISNDRGDFYLNVEPFRLRPGEAYTLSWDIMVHEGKDDFRKKLLQYEKYIDITSDRFVYFRGEEIVLRSNAEPAEIRDTADSLGERTYEFRKAGRTAKATVLVIPEFEELLANRCRFIAEHQQFRDEGSHLNGAYLIYDNETDSMFYSHWNDHNGGRERVAMGVIIALYLQEHEDEVLKKSLGDYLEYIRRELFDRETGVVFNDIRRNNDLNRMYNYPWFSVLFLEAFRVFRDKQLLIDAANAMKAMYKASGFEFYAIVIPMKELVEELGRQGMTELSHEMKDLFIRHAERIMEIGMDFPPFEVNFEQSIVSPAADYLIQAYELTGDSRFLEAGKKMIGILSLFNAEQPDYHMFEVAIRHWDGYWFGKRKLYGDTYPHYWSSITGADYLRYSRITGDKDLERKAEANLRGSLSMIFPDGRASCAMVYPRTVNGVKAHGFDPWANDQDWALYFYCKYGQSK